MRKYSPKDVATFDGSFDLTFSGPSATLKIVTEGCSVFFNDEGRQVLLWAGRGEKELYIFSSGPIDLQFEAEEDTYTSVMATEFRATTIANSPSFADLDSVYKNPISPEMRAVIDKMNRNAIVREQAMLRALGNRSRS